MSRTRAARLAIRRNRSSQCSRRDRRRPLFTALGRGFEPLEPRHMLAFTAIPAAEVIDGGYDAETGEQVLLGRRDHAQGADYFVWNIGTDGQTTERELSNNGAAFNVAGLSDNGRFAVGYVTQTYRGLFWDLAEPDAPTLIGFINHPESPAADVSNNGVVMGETNGGLTAYRWTSDKGLQPLEHIGLFHDMRAVSPDGRVGAGWASVGDEKVTAAVWEDGHGRFLFDPFSGHSWVWGISPDGTNFGGMATDRAVVWIDGGFQVLTDAAGNEIMGEVLGITDEGFAVGYHYDNDRGGFIWHPSWDGIGEPWIGAQDFNTWYAAASGGDALPTQVTSVESIQVHDGKLYFSARGLSLGVPGETAYAVVTDMPAIRTGKFTEVDADEVVDGGYDATTGLQVLVGHRGELDYLWTIDADGYVSEALLTDRGADVTVTAISNNGQWIVGYEDTMGFGVRWHRSAPDSPDVVPELFGGGSPAWDVSDNGHVVGDTAGAALSYVWTPETGTVPLDAHNGLLGVEQALAVSADGSIIAGSAVGAKDVFRPLYFDAQRNPHFLPEDAYNYGGAVRAVSLDGRHFGGDSGDRAVVWLDGIRAVVKDSDGNEVKGSVLAITDEGFAVGKSNSGAGFIWHPSWDGIGEPWVGAQDFNTWYATASGGDALPTQIVSVESIQVHDGKLYFSVAGAGGTAFVVTTEMPAIRTGEFTEVDADEVVDGGYDATTGLQVLVGHRGNLDYVWTIDASGHVTETELSNYAADVVLTAVSTNGEWIVGYLAESGLGLRWHRSTPHAPDVIPELVGGGSYAHGVSDSGHVVGDTAGAAISYIWSPETGTVALDNPNGPAADQAGAISADGNIVGGVAQDFGGVYKAVYFDAQGKQHFLPDPLPGMSVTRAVSPDGTEFGGEASGLAVVWLDGVFTIVKDVDGNDVMGRVLDITDDGFAVGKTDAGAGFIWHPSWAGIGEPWIGAQDFNTWYATASGGDALPTQVTSVESIQVHDGKLYFSVAGSGGTAYAVVTDMPAIRTGEFTEVDADEVVDGGYNATTGLQVLVGHRGELDYVWTIDAGGNVTETQLTNDGADAFVTAVSNNGQWIVGYDHATGLGLRWHVSMPHAPDHIPEIENGGSFAWDVSNSGLVVGDTHGATKSYHWTPQTGTIPLSDLNGPLIDQALAVSDDGSVGGGASQNGNGVLKPYYFDSAGNQYYLPDPTDGIGAVWAVSPGGAYFGGEASGLAVVWHDGVFTVLKNAAGHDVLGKVLDITDDGFAVGETNTGAGFIWHPSWDGIGEPWIGAQDFNTWYATASGGDALPRQITTVESVQRVGDKLYFSVGAAVTSDDEHLPEGVGYTVVVTVPTGEVEPPPPPPPPAPEISRLIIAPAAGAPPEVRLIDSETGEEIWRVMAYNAGFTGGVRVASADVNNDGADDIITAAGAGGGPHVKVFDGKTGQVVSEFFAYNAGFTGGVFVTAGDFDGDGRAEIVTGAGAGGGPHVRVFDALSGAIRSEYFPYNIGFAGGVQVAVGDIDGDGTIDIITGAGPGGGPHVKAHVGMTAAVQREFFAYDIGFTGGVYVAAGDVDGDDRADIITGAGAGGGPHVRVFSGTNGALVTEFFAYAIHFTGGVHVAVGDFDGDGLADIATTPGMGGGPHLRLFSGNSGALLRESFAGPIDFLGGLFAAGTSAMPAAEVAETTSPTNEPHRMAIIAASSTSGDSITAAASNPGTQPDRLMAWSLDQALANWDASVDWLSVDLLEPLSSQR